MSDRTQFARDERPKAHSFWDQAAVPGENDDDFKPFKSREYTGAAGIFRPKDEHCGIWHSPPNKACHASFGDQGTTASVSCCGTLVQMSQYLGVGHSGVFSLDQESTDEPYCTNARAERLNNLSADIHTGDYTLGLLLSEDLSPNEPLEVKWVNWRWSRYEYETSHPGVRAFIQWIVHNNIVLQQLLLENTSDRSVEVVSTLDLGMKTRDLDYPDREFLFNKNSTRGYTHISGPQGYGHVCVHPFLDGNSSSMKRVRSVASVTAVFVNGKAVKMNDGPEFHDHHTLEGQSSVEMRFIWLPEATDELALLCWVASLETVKSAMALFFDRHSKQEYHVWDDTTMVLNTWQTELHLSFFVLVGKELGVENSTLSLSVLGSRRNLSIKEDDSQNFEQLLQVVDEDLTSVLNTLQRWSTREKDRGREQPRWTHNDERKYRGAITKVQGSTERHIRDLEIRRDNMRKLREALTTHRERIRQDLEFHWNENIRYFTYVTVIFLPLGFASSFYSMSGAPDHSLIISLVEFAIAAFAVTVILLISAKSIFSAATKLSVSSRKRTGKPTALAMTKSLLAREIQEANEHNSEQGRKSHNNGSG
ncbi:hypothetical protein VP1G_03700 [Cytospora mali]|uniref:Uncharacterized protein n=1 Tax=Cytospora mali TaxID=578113 RepID=A0A194UXM8_CYTMA|nr:hypothetical protein VP1G_03700 [Valsa mali var. pyri (nom. inval.)]